MTSRSFSASIPQGQTGRLIHVHNDAIKQVDSPGIRSSAAAIPHRQSNFGTLKGFFENITRKDVDRDNLRPTQPSKDPPVADPVVPSIINKPTLRGTFALAKVPAKDASEGHPTGDSPKVRPRWRPFTAKARAASGAPALEAQPSADKKDGEEEEEVMTPSKAKSIWKTLDKKASATLPVVGAPVAAPPVSTLPPIIPGLKSSPNIVLNRDDLLGPLERQRESLLRAQKALPSRRQAWT
jgi:hypothetical protein